MRKLMATLLALGAILPFCVIGVDAQPKAVKAAWFRADISCDVGTTLAGYGNNDVSVEKIDDLELNGLCIDDGNDKVLIMSFDLIGLDNAAIRKIRNWASTSLGVKEANVLVSSTHTHGGPHTEMYRNAAKLNGSSYRIPDDPSHPDAKYPPFFDKVVSEAIHRFAQNPGWREVYVGFYSSSSDENRNRRFTTADNHASFIAHRRTLHKIATGVADKELGTLALFDPQTYAPLFVLGNYAAHPLASHAPGKGGLRITSDFPGFYRRYIEAETGAQAMFVMGACGDLVPKGDELGTRAARRVGENLAEASLADIIDIQRNSQRFMMSKPIVGGRIEKFEAKLRARWREVYERDAITLEVQCVSIGDVAFVGVPGEMTNELGLEIKWHSPYRRTFIAYCGTDYFGYISTANQVAAGGYEPQLQKILARESLRLVTVSQNALFSLRSTLYPEDEKGEDGYPDNQNLPLVNLPGGVKASKWRNKK
jgi:hypothetical protein